MGRVCGLTIIQEIPCLFLLFKDQILEIEIEPIQQYKYYNHELY